MERINIDTAHCQEFPARLQPAMAVLSEAYDYAHRTNSNPWEFACEIDQFRKMGLSANDLRFLVRQGLVEHARETTVVGQNGRTFQPTGDLTFTRRTCFILTALGIELARGCYPEASDADDSDSRGNDVPLISAPTVRAVVPVWDPEKRQLLFDGRIVKRFKWHAENQEKVLAAFEEEGWPFRIDDPLPPQGEQDPKRRLSDTIKCLNRKQANELLHFRGDGTGEGVIWEFGNSGPQSR